MPRNYYSDNNRGVGNGRQYSSGGSRTRNFHRNNRSQERSHSGRNRVMSAQEKEERMERHRRAMRKKKARQRAFTYRAVAIGCVITVVFIIWKVVTGITGYITDSRQQKVDAMQNIEINKGNDSIDVAGQTFAAETTLAETTEAAVETTEAYDPTHVLSNGRYVDTTKPMVALTWDDGPNGQTGERIMDLLEANNGRGTFFIVGNRISEFSSEVQRMAANGHEIANHSWDHDIHLSKNSTDYIVQEFEKTNNAVKELVGTAPALIRLPGGNISDSVRKALTQPMIYWSIDTLDWKSKDAAAIIETIKPHVKDGDIILMHELYNSTVSACEEIIPWLAQQGYQMVTVSELAAFHNAECVGGNGKQYSSFPYVAPPEATTEETAASISATAASSKVSESSEKSSDSGTKAAARETASETKAKKKSEESNEKAATEAETSATETAAVSTEANDDEVIEAPVQDDDTYVPTSAQEAQKVSETAAWMAVGQNPGAGGDVQSDAIQAAAPN